MQDRQSSRLRLDKLWVVRPQRGGHYNGVWGAELGRVMANVYFGTECSQLADVWTLTNIGTGDFVAHTDYQASDAAHAVPADADEVDGP